MPLNENLKLYLLEVFGKLFKSLQTNIDFFSTFPKAFKSFEYFAFHTFGQQAISFDSRVSRVE